MEIQNLQLLPICTSSYHKKANEDIYTFLNNGNDTLNEAFGFKKTASNLKSLSCESCRKHLSLTGSVILPCALHRGDDTQLKFINTWKM